MQGSLYKHWCMTYKLASTLCLVKHTRLTCCVTNRSVWDDYEADTELIGRGAFARVFKAIRRSDQQAVAVKVIGRETKAFSQQRRGELPA